MSGMEFTVDLVRAIAWPVAVVLLVVVLRHQIADLLAQAATSLRRLRAGPIELEWEHTAMQTGAELSTAAASREPPAAAPASLRLSALADGDPMSAINQGLNLVEQALMDLLKRSGGSLPSGPVDPRVLARTVRDRGLIPESAVRSVDGISVMRNLAAQDSRGITHEKALEYLTLVEAVLYSIDTHKVQPDESLRSARQTTVTPAASR